MLVLVLIVLSSAGNNDTLRLLFRRTAVDVDVDVDTDDDVDDNDDSGAMVALFSSFSSCRLLI